MLVFVSQWCLLMFSCMFGLGMGLLGLDYLYFQGKGSTTSLI